MQEELNKLKQDFENLKKEFDSLKASTTIPLNIDNAFRDRFKISEFVQLSATVKTAGSETQAVHIQLQNQWMALKRELSVVLLVTILTIYD